MSYKALNNIQAINDSLETPSSTREFQLGSPIPINDTTKGQERFVAWTASKSDRGNGR